MKKDDRACLDTFDWHGIGMRRLGIIEKCGWRFGGFGWQSLSFLGWCERGYSLVSLGLFLGLCAWVLGAKRVIVANM